MAASVLWIRSADGGHLGDAFSGHHDDAVSVAAHHVAGSNADPANGQRSLHGSEPHPVLPGPHEPPDTPHRITGGRDFVDVAAYAVDHGGRDSVDGGSAGHDAAPHRGVGPPQVVDDDDRAGRGHRRGSRRPCRAPASTGS